MNTAVQQLLQSFDALSETDRRVAPMGESDMPGSALVQAADELFLALDAEESRVAQR